MLQWKICFDMMVLVVVLIRAKYLRSVGHGFHASGNHDAALAEHNVLSSKRNSLHTGSADLVDGGSLGGVGAARLESDLTSRRLADVTLENVAHVDLLDLVRLEAGALDRSLHGHNTQLRSGSLLENTIERANGGSGGGKDKDVVDLRLFQSSLAQHAALRKRGQLPLCGVCRWDRPFDHVLPSVVVLGIRTMILAVWESRATAVW